MQGHKSNVLFDFYQFCVFRPFAPGICLSHYDSHYFSSHLFVEPSEAPTRAGATQCLGQVWKWVRKSVRARAVWSCGEYTDTQLRVSTLRLGACAFNSWWGLTKYQKKMVTYCFLESHSASIVWLWGLGHPVIPKHGTASTQWLPQLLGSMRHILQLTSTNSHKDSTGPPLSILSFFPMITHTHIENKAL